MRFGLMFCCSMSARSHGDDLSLTGSQISTRSSLKKSSSARQLNRPSSAAGSKTSQGVSQFIITFISIYPKCCILLWYLTIKKDGHKIDVMCYYCWCFSILLSNMKNITWNILFNDYHESILLGWSQIQWC